MALHFEDSKNSALKFVPCKMSGLASAVLLPDPLTVRQCQFDGSEAKPLRHEDQVRPKALDGLAPAAFQRQPARQAQSIANVLAHVQGIAHHTAHGKPLPAEPQVAGAKDQDQRGNTQQRGDEIAPRRKRREPHHQE